MKTLHLILLVMLASLLSWQKTISTRAANSLTGFSGEKPIAKSAETSLLQNRMIIVPGNKPSWTLIGLVPANNSFQIQGSGTVDFGCRLGACKDGVNAGVTGDAFARLFRNTWGTIDKLLEDMAQGNGSESVAFNQKIANQPGEDISTYIVRKRNNNETSADFFFKNYTKTIGSKVNYDQGGFWIVMTTNSTPPVNGQNIFCDPALFFWYNQLYKELVKENFSPVMRFTQPVWVWVLAHDGGRNAFDLRPQDFHDNSGSYKVWIQ